MDPLAFKMRGRMPRLGEPFGEPESEDEFTSPERLPPKGKKPGGDK